MLALTLPPYVETPHGYSLENWASDGNPACGGPWQTRKHRQEQCLGMHKTTRTVVHGDTAKEPALNDSKIHAVH